MPRPPRRRRAAGVLAALVGLGLPLLGSAPADAGPGTVPSQPIAEDDAFGVYASGEYTVDVLSNDTATGLVSDPLTLCAVTVGDQAQQLLYAEIDRNDPTLVYLETKRTASGVVTFTYDVCQGDERDTSTVTVEITRLAAPKVRKLKNRPAQITARNPNEVGLKILWGSNRVNVNDGQRGIPAGRTVNISVKRTRIYWVAYLRDQGTIVVAGEGTIQKIKRK